MGLSKFGAFPLTSAFANSRGQSDLIIGRQFRAALLALCFSLLVVALQRQR
jgi:hypothetical protein